MSITQCTSISRNTDDKIGRIVHPVTISHYFLHFTIYYCNLLPKNNWKLFFSTPEWVARPTNSILKKHILNKAMVHNDKCGKNKSNAKYFLKPNFTIFVAVAMKQKMGNVIDLDRKDKIWDLGAIIMQKEWPLCHKTSCTLLLDLNQLSKLIPHFLIEFKVKSKVKAQLYCNLNICFKRLIFWGNTTSPFLVLPLHPLPLYLCSVSFLRSPQYHPQMLLKDETRLQGDISLIGPP